MKIDAFMLAMVSALQVILLVQVLPAAGALA